MIKSITVTNHVDDTITLELTRPEKSGFIIKSIDGLGPVKADIGVTEVATNDGGLYNSARTTFRNIVMNLMFMMTDTETIENIRHKSYKYFPLKQKISIVIETDNRTVKTEGYVESNEPDIFSEEEGCNISIVCPDPHLYAIKNHETLFSGIIPLFEFPFENALHTYELEMGEIVNVQTKDINYQGDSEIGMVMIIHAIGPASKIVIYNVNTREQMFIDTDKITQMTGTGITNGDTITINTKTNHKSITLLRDGVEINILNCLRRDSKWLKLYQGDNIIAYTADGISNLQFSITNEIVYDGV